MSDLHFKMPYDHKSVPDMYQVQFKSTHFWTESMLLVVYPEETVQM